MNLSSELGLDLEGYPQLVRPSEGVSSKRGPTVWRLNAHVM